MKLGLDLIAIIISGISVMISLIFGILANRKSNESNIRAMEANRIAEASLYSAVNSELSNFVVRLKQIELDINGTTSTSIENAVKHGSAKCTFEIHNISKADAQRVGFEDSKRVAIGAGERKTITYKCKLSPSTPEGAGKYQLLSTLLWSNGIFNCSCKVAFTYCIEEVGEGMEKFRAVIEDPEETPCRLFDPAYTYPNAFKTTNKV